MNIWVEHDDTLKYRRSRVVVEEEPAAIGPVTVRITGSWLTEVAAYNTAHKLLGIAQQLSPRFDNERRTLEEYAEAYTDDQQGSATL